MMLTVSEKLREAYELKEAFYELMEKEKEIRFKNNLSIKELQDVFSDNDYSSDFEGIRNRFVIELFYTTGIRRAELINLKLNSVNDIQKTKALAKINRKAMLLKNLARNFNDLSKFINSMILGGSEMSEGDGVNLLSIHASKGLEFKEVYVIDLMDGRFPNRKLMSKGGSIEEERRLFYVAVTRAKDILYLSYAKYDKIKKITFVASPFLKEAGMIIKDSEES